MVRPGRSMTEPTPAYTLWSPKAFFRALNSGSPVQCPGATRSSLYWVMEHRGDAFDLSIGFLNLVHAAEQNVYMRINRARRLQDVLHARVRAADNQDEALRALDGQRQLLQLQRARRTGNAGKDKHSRRHLGLLAEG